VKAVAAALRELWGLFVEDASLTVAIAVCIALAAFMAREGVAPQFCGPLLFLALALVLLENSYRSARRSR
jgi:hypothetical protein